MFLEVAKKHACSNLNVECSCCIIGRNLCNKLFMSETEDEAMTLLCQNFFTATSKCSGACVSCPVYGTCESLVGLLDLVQIGKLDSKAYQAILQKGSDVID